MFMKNGSLDRFLFSEDSEVLNWETRYKIAIGTAKGITYLHEECRDCIVHCDIKPENVLLDDNYSAKVSDFGLAKLINLKEQMNQTLTRVRGTRGYLAHEWLSNTPVTSTSDVYSYGMVLLEIVGGWRNFDVSEKRQEGRCPLLGHMKSTAGGGIRSIIDKRLHDSEIDMAKMERAFQVSFWCIQEQPSQRPSMWHGKFESLGALGISCMLLGTAGGIAWHAFDVLQAVVTSTPDMINHTLDHHNHSHGHGGHHHGFDLDHPILALSMTILSISVKEGLYWITKRAGEKHGSGLMKANAWHHRADAVSSVVALVGVGGSLLGVPFVDPLAGIVVSGMVFKAGIETGYQSVMELVDAGAPLTVLAPIRQTITQVEGVKGCHRLRGRQAGSFLYLDVHIEVDPFLSVSAAHDIGENVRQLIQKSHNQVAEVFIHIDPSYSHYYTMSDETMTSKNFENQNANFSKQQEAEAVVSHVISSLFQEKMTVEHITLHKFKGNVLLQVQVSIPPEFMIQDAINMAREAEKEILKASSSINQVSILLRLGHPIQGLLVGKNYQQDAEN